MFRIAKAAAVAAVGCAVVLGGAGAASATGDPHGGHHKDQHKGQHGGHHKGRHKGGHHGAHAQAVAIGSPGFLSGNVVQFPIYAPTNLCGNSGNVLGALNPAVGNVCVNG